MQIFSRLYQKALDWAQSKYAIYWLSIVSFLESSILPYPPPDVILAPMTLKQPNKAYYYALVCTITSVLGGLAGYFLGEILLNFLLGYGLIKVEMIEVAKQWFDQYDIWFVGLAAFSPLPYKLATITAGTMNMALLPFILISLLARGARYYLVAFLVRKFGTQADVWLHKHVDRLGYVLVIIVILGIWYVN
ncbi:MAG: YqaA family protein [Candidatus Thioglobus sp.]|jgi:Predicted membrane protein|nr:DedA family protein [Candidatus Thioglobus sp.]